MILQAEQDWDIDLAQSTLIGDKGSDIQAGQAAGLKRCILVQNGQRVSAEDV